MSRGFWNERVPELLDEVVGMYRAAGRPLAELTDDDLDASFVDTVDAYIAAPRTPARFRAVNEFAAEYVLRRRAAPIERAMPLSLWDTIDQSDKKPLGGAIVLPRNLMHMAKGLPIVVLAFGRYGTIPSAGIIFTVHNDPPEEQHAWRKWRDELSTEFDWLLLGHSAARDERVVSLDDARARLATG